MDQNDSPYLEIEHPVFCDVDFSAQLERFCNKEPEVVELNVHDGFAVER